MSKKKAAIIGAGFSSIVHVEEINPELAISAINSGTFDYIILDIRHIVEQNELDSIIKTYLQTRTINHKTDIILNEYKTNVLIIDDEEISREIAKDAVIEVIPSANIIEASTGEEGFIYFIQMMKSGKKPDIIILDINFGEGKKTGIEILRKIRDIEIQYGYATKNDNGEIVSAKNKIMTNIIIYTSSQEDIHMIISGRYGANIVQKNIPDIKAGIQFFITPSS